MKTRTYFAQAVSLGMHALGFLALLFVLNQPANSPDQLPLVKSNQQLIYVASAPGSSRGGGGSPAPAPPTPAAIPKPQPMTVVPIVSAAPADPPPALNAPVMTSPDALLAASGVNGAVAVPRGGGPGTGNGTGQGPGLGPSAGPGFGDTGIGGSGGIEMPYRVMEVKPQYTAEAMRAKLQGPVVLEAVLDVSGKVTDVRVIKSLDRLFGLDEAARRAALATPFRPCKKDGKPIACIITFELQFTLR